MLMIAQSPLTLATGTHTLLRDTLAEDVEAYVRWQSSGEWRDYDAPWETLDEVLTKEQENEYRERFLANREKTLPNPRQRATVATLDNIPLGWVNYYKTERFPNIGYVGIDICEDEYLNKGLGTEALHLWVNYLFENTTFHKIGLNTWSFNPRVIHVAEKLGFTYEGRQRELIEWQGYMLDLMHFGILRSEWEKENSGL